MESIELTKEQENELFPPDNFGVGKTDAPSLIPPPKIPTIEPPPSFLIMESSEDYIKRLEIKLKRIQENQSTPKDEKSKEALLNIDDFEMNSSEDEEIIPGQEKLSLITNDVLEKEGEK